jgi:hypothetical protein
MILTFCLLIAAIWLVGNAMLGALVAPTLFSHAPHDITRAQAGLLFGDLLGTWINIVDVSLWLTLMVLIAVLAGALLISKRAGTALLCLLAIGALAGVHLMARSAAQEAAEASPAAKGTSVQVLPAEQHEAFQAVHRRSEILFTTETGLLLVLVFAFAVALATSKPEGKGGGDKPKKGGK